MSTKNLLLLALAVILMFVLGFGGIWLALGGKQSQDAKKEARAEATQEKEAKKEAALTSTVDLFQLALPCKRNAEGNTPIVHADF